jgi:UDP-N-acetylmuramate--alanine ligase
MIYHFIGIGGIGMSALAEILHAYGETVQGSDISENASVKRLKDKGIKVFIGHNASNLPEEGSTVVISTAIPKDNVELNSARSRSLNVIHRADVLAKVLQNHAENSVAISGTHGKTTTTALTYTLMQACGIETGVINGGVIKSIGTNAQQSDGWMVVEADESDGSFTKLHSTVAVVTSMDPEHMEHYGGMDKVRSSYKKFVSHVPDDGFAVLSAEDGDVRCLAALQERNSFFYGFSEMADVRALNIRQENYTTVFDMDAFGDYHQNIILNMPGKHNVQNALAAILICLKLGGKISDMRPALANFAGVGRRFNKLGTLENMTVVDDYAHHPVEIEATLKTAKNVFKGKVLAVIQPHRYSRLQDLMSGFTKSIAAADAVLIAPVYSAGEEPIEGINAEALAQKIKETGKAVLTINDEADLKKRVVEAQHGWKGDQNAVICLGAGSISAWAHNLCKGEHQ